LVLLWYYVIMISSSDLFLGVDGGGSRCRARIRNAAGDILGEAVGGPSNIYQDFEAAVATILVTTGEAAAKAGVKIDKLHAGLGIAGLVSSDGGQALHARLPFASAVVDSDAVAACLGAFAGGDGGIVIAGTGSIGFALVEGARHMVGGWGFALGDHGSGAWIGHHAVRRAALVIDGLLQPTPLIERVMAKAGSNRVTLSRWSENAAPRDFAQFAPAVFECAAKGDVIAMTIVIEGSSAISNLGRALLARGARRLCLLGGLSGVYPQYLDADMRRVLAAPAADAVDGAMMMARRAKGLPALPATAGGA
jgi:glucosamine kinase